MCACRRPPPTRQSSVTDIWGLLANFLKSETQSDSMDFCEPSCLPLKRMLWISSQRFGHVQRLSAPPAPSRPLPGSSPLSAAPPTKAGQLQRGVRWRCVQRETAKTRCWFQSKASVPGPRQGLRPQCWPPRGSALLFAFLLSVSSGREASPLLVPRPTPAMAGLALGVLQSGTRHPPAPRCPPYSPASCVSVSFISVSPWFALWALLALRGCPTG